jgi:hypothetical protein
MSPDTAALVLEEWERQLGDAFRAHFRNAYTYLGRTVRELASDEATWSIARHEDHLVLLLAGDTAFAVVAFSGPPDGVTIKGALHPLDEGVIRVSFSDQLADNEVAVEGMQPFRPMIRRWSFDWHGRLQLPIEHWLPLLQPVPGDSTIWVTLRHHERQRAMAHKLARAAGWPLPAESGADEAS